MQFIGRRAAFLAGVSFSALCSPTVALAATATRPGIQHSDTSDPVSDTLTICNIGTPPMSPCFYGIEAGATGHANATLDAVSDGEIWQTGIAGSGNVWLTLANDGIAVITALAIADSATSTASANARINGAVRQYGQGPADVQLSFANDGGLAIHAAAIVSAPAAAGHATAVVSGGIDQHALGTGAGLASIALTNSDELDIAATAHAIGGGTRTAATTFGSTLAQASALAGVRRGIWDVVNASGDAAIDLHNEGNIVLAARATATALTGTAFALASITSGLAQEGHAFDGGDAISELTNDGAIDILAHAVAAGSSAAIAVATIIAGVIQTAEAIGGGEASVDLVNRGSILEEATAIAQGGSAQATVVEIAALDQSAFASIGSGSHSASARADLNNLGSIQIQGLAEADAQSGNAQAIAFGAGLYLEKAVSVGGDAAASLTNAGAIELLEVANAEGSGPAAAAAIMTSAFLQLASGSSADAGVAIDNSGGIEIAAVAHAAGVATITTSGTTPVAHFVQASAVETFALREQSFTLGGGDASARFDNAGELDLLATASASGDGSLGGVIALASLDVGLQVVAQAFTFASSAGAPIGNAVAAFDNSGTIDVGAKASVDAVGGGEAGAFAVAAFGVIEAANVVNGDASAVFTNSGSLIIGASADAHLDATASAGSSAIAVAGAGLNFVLGQNVNADEGFATGTFDNSGSIDLVAVAHASADSAAATAGASDFGGLRQLNKGLTGAGGLLTNSGTLDVFVQASATGETAGANAAALLAVLQEIEAPDGNAVAEFDNTGSIEIVSLAAASGTVADAAANAAVIAGIEQVATAGGGHDASGHFQNEGSLLLIASAQASAAAHASAQAVEIGGLVQGIIGNGDGVAVGDLSNAASVTEVAKGDALGASASAAAIVANGVFQNIQGHPSFSTTFTASGTVFSSGPAGDVEATLNNSGSIMVAAIADAQATAGSAVANVQGNNIVAQLLTTPDGSGRADFTNSGTIAVMESGAATGTGAFAGAAIGGGIQQLIEVGGNATGALTNSGDIVLAAVAHAGGQGGFGTTVIGTGSTAQTSNFQIGVTASAVIVSGLAQGATGIGTASADLTNSGSIMLAAVAGADGRGATATIPTTGTTIFFAESGAQPAESILTANVVAHAVVAGGVRQVAAGSTTADDATAALAHLTNSGSIAVAASAAASNSGTGSALAAATVATGVQQIAIGLSGTASGTITNSGLLDVVAKTKATAVNDANAIALIVGGVEQHVEGTAGATGLLANDDTINLVVSASALAGESGFAFAAGAVQGAIVQQVVAVSHTVDFQSTSAGFVSQVGTLPSGEAKLTLDNEGSITIAAAASVKAGEAGQALAIDTAIVQTASGSLVDVGLTNSSTLNILAMASASVEQSATATAFVIGIEQGAFASNLLSIFTSASDGHKVTNSRLPDGAATVGLTNSGALAINAVAEAHATGSEGSALANASLASGVHQVAVGTAAGARLDNLATLRLQAVASATAADRAAAVAAVSGVRQTVFATGAISGTAVNSTGASTGHFTAVTDGTAAADLNNSGTLSITAAAVANGDTAAADAFANGVSQLAVGTSAAVSIENSGMFEVQALAKATGLNAAGDATAVGATQFAVGTGGSVNFSNNGHFKALADVSVNGDVRSSGIAVAVGLQQDPEALSASAAVDNAATFVVVAHVAAAGSTHADAEAFAAGIRQDPFRGDYAAGLDNSGKIMVAAQATDHVDDGSAFAAAFATGYQASGSHIVAEISNSGSLDVLAAVDAVASTGSAQAQAVGLDIFASANTAIAAPGLIEGSIVNAGMIEVDAAVAGAGTRELSSGTAAALSHASAVGIRLTSGANAATVTNSGVLLVQAMSANGGDADATGILAKADGIPGDGSMTLTINNSGDIVVRNSTDNGDSWHRGNAIDVSNAPNPTVVNLLGGGTIYGNILLQDDDEINVKQGATYFNGIINPAFAGPALAALPTGGSPGVGTLNIDDGGNFILGDPRITGAGSAYDGPSYAFIDALNVAPGGTLTFQFEPASAGTQAAGTYSQVFSRAADLSGTLAIDIQTANGLFADNYSWEDAIDAESITGKFDHCNSGRVLLSLTCSYDDGANVDLQLTRVAFGAAPGLNGNGTATGNGLESVYDPSATGDIADLFKDLFKLPDTTTYNKALNELSGSVYANYLQSFPALGARYAGLIDRGSECDRASTVASSLECRDSSRFRVWGQLDFEHAHKDGDGEAGSTVSRRLTTLAGLDSTVGADAVVGVAVGYVTNHVRDHQFDDTAEAKGNLIGTYAAYDPGPFFVKGIASYSWFNGNSRRHIDLHALNVAASFTARPQGDPDVHMFTASLHGGARFATGSASVATGYLNLDYVQSTLDRFTETGGHGAELSVAGNSDRLFATAGVRWSTQLGRVSPQFNLAYRERFGNRRSSTRENFASGDDFTIVSASQKRGSILAGLSIGGELGPLNIKLDYQGEFSGSLTSHSGSLKLILPLGGHAAPTPKSAVSVASQ